VKKLNYGGYSDWRLPTKDELAFFVKRFNSSTSVRFKTSEFINVKAGWYWSATEILSGLAWAVNMEDGGVAYNFSQKDRGNGFYAWPVRVGK